MKDQVTQAMRELLVAIKSCNLEPELKERLDRMLKLSAPFMATLVEPLASKVRCYVVFKLTPLGELGVDVEPSVHKGPCYRELTTQLGKCGVDSSTLHEYPEYIVSKAETKH